MHMRSCAIVCIKVSLSWKLESLLNDNTNTSWNEIERIELKLDAELKLERFEFGTFNLIHSIDLRFLFSIHQREREHEHSHSRKLF
jgi:hypothetical protein